MMDDIIQETKPIGASPETLILSGVKRTESTKLKWTCYDENSYTTRELNELSEIGEREGSKKYWLDLSGLHDGALVGEVCQHFSINRMVGEDVMNTLSLAKVESFDDFLYISQKIPLQGDSGELEIHQLSLLLLDNVLISFTEVESDFFAPIYKRMSVSGSRMSTNGSDYLAWALMDLGVDHTLSYISQLEKGLENVESMIINSKSLPALPDVHIARSEVTQLHRSLRPYRGVVQHLCGAAHSLIDESTKLYLNDLLDHVGFAIESTEFLREQSASLRELYYTTTSHRMNEVMKLLAIVSAIFMPLSFLAGVYGMNFVNIPELGYKNGYFILLGIFFTIATSLVIIFKKRGWF